MIGVTERSSELAELPQTAVRREEHNHDCE